MSSLREVKSHLRDAGGKGMSPSNGFLKSAKIRTLAEPFIYLDPGVCRIQKVHQASDDCKSLYKSTELSTKEVSSIEAYEVSKLSPERREQMCRETEALLDLSHPNIPRLVEVQEHGDYIYLVMDKIQGRPLSSILSFRSLSTEEAYSVLYQLGDALEYMHEEGNLGHGDVNPLNLFLSKDGDKSQLTIIGFGHSRLDASSVTLSSSVPGTPGFIPRDQICNPQLRVQADIHGMGMTAFCILTRISVEEANKHIDLKTGKVTFPEELQGKYWELKVWIARCVSPKSPYTSVRDAMVELELLEGFGKLTLSDKPKSRLLVEALLTLAIGVSGIGGGVLVQQRWIASINQKNEEVQLQAESLLANAKRDVERRKKLEKAAALEAKKDRNFRRLKRTNRCRGCDLSNLDLSGMDFSGADLRGADFTGSWLKSTNLEGADLTGAKLAGARLENANLRRANLTESDLSNANLFDASAVQACFLSADLSGTDFRAADLENASFERANTLNADFGWSTIRRGAIDATGDVWFGENTASPACD
jgi:uncharacterized protein YjbI with pentapeptide repeats